MVLIYVREGSSLGCVALYHEIRNLFAQEIGLATFLKFCLILLTFAFLGAVLFSFGIPGLEKSAEATLDCE